jgi:type I restriction enzyme S subunit
VNKPPSSPTLDPSTRQGQNVLALGEPAGLAGTLLGLIEHTIAIGRLRALIIELATSGRLRQRKTGAFRQSTIGPAPEQLPEGWVRLPLNELAVDFQNGIAKRSGDRGTPIPVLRLADITRLRLKETELREIILTPEEQTKYQVDRGDFLVIRVNGSGELVGRFIPCTVQRQWAYSDHLIRVRPRADLVDQRYLCLFANSETARRHLVDKTVTTAGQKTINQGGLGSLPVVVPPIEEQKRIVAKVDQLMALCDDLEAKQTKKRDLATQSTRSALTALTTAETADDLATTWQRVSTNFPSLVGSASSIPQLRRSVLSLAVQGKLTERCAGDVPAATLLATINPGEWDTSETIPMAPYGVPAGWEWANFSHCASIESNLVSPEKFNTSPHVAPDNIEKGTGRLLACRTIGEDGMTSGKHRFFAGQILYSKIRPNLSKVVIVDFNGLCSADMYPIKAKIDTRYLHLFMLSSAFLEQVVRDDNRLAMPKVNQEQLRSTIVAVPSLAEQKRIVAEVGHIMSLLDDLEAKLRKQEETAIRLAESLAAAVAA